MNNIADLLQVIAWVALGAVAYAGYHRGTCATEMAAQATMTAQFLIDRAGVSERELHHWHMEQHPECAPQGPVRDGQLCPLCRDVAAAGSEYDEELRELTVYHQTGTRCAQAPVTPGGDPS